MPARTEFPRPRSSITWQAVPSVIGAVKRAVDEDPRPGRYLITGSARAGRDPQLWPGPGRLVRVTMSGLTLREMQGDVTTAAFLDHTLPAWTSNRLKRLVRTPKRYLVDPALAAGALGLDVNGVLRDGDLLGRLLDTFVAAQLRAELPLCSTQPRLYHLRQEQGRHEVDLLAELAGDRVVAVEVTADAAPGPEAARHLRWLREELGQRFLGGVILHTGRRTYEVANGIPAVPICALWG